MRYKRHESIVTSLFLFCSGFLSSAAAAGNTVADSNRLKTENLRNLLRIFRRLENIQQQLELILTEDLEIARNIPILDKINGLQRQVDSCFEKTGLKAVLELHIIQTKSDYILNALEDNDTRYKASVKSRDDRKFKVTEEYKRLIDDFPILKENDAERFLHLHQRNYNICIIPTHPQVLQFRIANGDFNIYDGRSLLLSTSSNHGANASLAIKDIKNKFRISFSPNEVIDDVTVTTTQHPNVASFCQEAYISKFIPQLIAMNKDIENKIAGMQMIYDNLSSNYLKVGFRIVEEINHLAAKIERLQAYVGREHYLIMKDEFY